MIFDDNLRRAAAQGPEHFAPENIEPGSVIKVAPSLAGIPGIVLACRFDNPPDGAPKAARLLIAFEGAPSAEAAESWPVVNVSEHNLTMMARQITMALAIAEGSLKPRAATVFPPPARASVGKPRNTMTVSTDRSGQRRMPRLTRGA